MSQGYPIACLWFDTQSNENPDYASNAIHCYIETAPGAFNITNFNTTSTHSNLIITTDCNTTTEYFWVPAETTAATGQYNNISTAINDFTHIRDAIRELLPCAEEGRFEPSSPLRGEIDPEDCMGAESDPGMEMGQAEKWFREHF